MTPKGTYKQYPVQDETETIVGNNVTVISPYMTKKEVAKYFRCSTRTIDNRVKLGLIKKVIINGFTLYPKKENRINID